MDNRKDYWDTKYLEYWHARVSEAGQGRSAIIEGDSKTEDVSVYESIFSEHGLNPGNILDVGCAWGRMFPMYLERSLEVYGVDISTAMVHAAEETWHHENRVKAVKEAIAEQLPFPGGFFNNLVCLATYDATYQHQSLTEFLRVTKPEGRIYLSGKNTHYFQDDEQAYQAEIGARRKGHPNYFTDVPKLIQELTSQGHCVDYGYYFPRRGDFASMNFRSNYTTSFYEFLLVIKRGDGFLPIPELSSAFSHTFREKQES